MAFCSGSAIIEHYTLAANCYAPAEFPRKPHPALLCGFAGILAYYGNNFGKMKTS
jgi:hypothetical protein